MITEQNILASFEPLLQHTEPSHKAWQMLRELHLPGKKSEAYKFTPITSVLERDVEIEKTGKDIYDVNKRYATEGSHLIFINGLLDESKSTFLGDLKWSLVPVQEGKHDPFSLLNTSLAQQEIEIISGTDHPVFVYHFNDAGISNPRISVKVKSGETLQIVERFVHGGADTFTNAYISFDIEKNASAYHTKVQNYSSTTLSHEGVHASVNADSKFFSNTFSFESKMTRNNLTIDLNGQGSEGYMHGLFLLGKTSHIDNNTAVDHKYPHTYSNELFKGILDEKSTGVFNGKIFVRQDAQKTNAFQSNNNILLSEETTLHTKPQLEIWADDVKCSHGCTSGQLDEDAIFYLRARGIDKTTAKAMLLQAFANETLQHTHIEELNEEVLGLIEEKLR